MNLKQKIITGGLVGLLTFGSGAAMKTEAGFWSDMKERHNQNKIKNNIEQQIEDKYQDEAMSDFARKYLFEERECSKHVDAEITEMDLNNHVAQGYIEYQHYTGISFPSYKKYFEAQVSKENGLEDDLRFTSDTIPEFEKEIRKNRFEWVRKKSLEEFMDEYCKNIRGFDYYEKTPVFEKWMIPQMVVPSKNGNKAKFAVTLVRMDKEYPEVKKVVYRVIEVKYDSSKNKWERIMPKK